MEIDKELVMRAIKEAAIIGESKWPSSADRICGTVTKEVKDGPNRYAYYEISRNGYLWETYTFYHVTVRRNGEEVRWSGNFDMNTKECFMTLFQEKDNEGKRIYFHVIHKFHTPWDEANVVVTTGEEQ